ncbi:LysR family transcriptional regulator [Burkholderia sp. AU19243]|uniref:LysR family transcriptional regulator n=1 Tax=Burkholderia latens TaxID=488446 RepID=A0AAP1C2U7_9BURK|nr:MULTISPECIES: LysR family transcriptional regulator [Burkholderia]MBR7959709.1 LysR family transcriptional regulator [Burkholderia vietnamiensis]AOK07943.1 LysR family transcriptional regulator [Burkholderia latens]KUZ98553.1 LysR family transcriptional regulator [Burkholderia latens]MBR8144812.1 LysR family transcriptional regulator [Burkholderia vietnamiensis]MBR8366645.1 LysR family transcriptional regulator [Burkholderia sp. AU19243]
MTIDLSWERYRTFLAVLTEGSLSGAARALGITQPTAGRHVAALEAAFGQTLFTRSPSGLLPTEAALALRGHAEALRSAAAAFERAAASHGAGVRGTVRISASDVIAVEVLPPILAQLRRDHPGVVIELVATDRVQDVLNREADIAVRMASPAQEALIARRVGAIDVGLHARDDYLARTGTPATLDELAHHALIGFDTVTPFIRSAARGMPFWKRDAFALRTDSNLAHLAMIRAGYGIGFCQNRLAQRDARLVRVLPDELAMALETWIVMHEDLRTSPRCRAVFDALANGLRAYAEGTAE